MTSLLPGPLPAGAAQPLSGRRGGGVWTGGGGEGGRRGAHLMMVLMRCGSQRRGAAGRSAGEPARCVRRRGERCLGQQGGVVEGEGGGGTHRRAVGRVGLVIPRVGHGRAVARPRPARGGPHSEARAGLRPQHGASTASAVAGWAVGVVRAAAPRCRVEGARLQAVRPWEGGRGCWLSPWCLLVLQL